MTLQDQYYIIDKRGWYYSSGRSDKYYNHSDFCNDIKYAIPFEKIEYAKWFLDNYYCYEIDGNTRVPLKIVKLNVVDA